MFCLHNYTSLGKHEKNCAIALFSTFSTLFPVYLFIWISEGNGEGNYINYYNCNRYESVS